MSLSTEERRDLRDLLNIVLPEDSNTWTSQESDLNEQTLAHTEQFLVESTRCTQRMHKLLLDLAGSFTRGWLRRVLRSLSKAAAKESAYWRGNAACYVAAKSRYRSTIVGSLI